MGRHHYGCDVSVSRLAKTASILLSRHYDAPRLVGHLRFTLVGKDYYEGFTAEGDS